MNDAVEAKLQALLARHGIALLDEPRRVESLLRDECGGSPAEISALLGAQRAGIPRDLCSTASLLPWSVLEDRLVRQLLQEEPMSAEAARWSVWAWARALGHAVAPLSPSTRPVEAPAGKGWVWVAGLTIVVLLGLIAYLITPRVLRSRADSLLGKDDLRAVSVYNRVLQMTPNDRSARMGRATALLNLRKPGEAEQDLTDVLRREPRFAEAYFLRGQARAMQGNSSGAIEDFTRTLEIDPQHANAYRRRAEFHSAAGRGEAARADLEQADRIEKPRQAR